MFCHYGGHYQIGNYIHLLYIFNLCESPVLEYDVTFEMEMHNWGCAWGDILKVYPRNLLMCDYFQVMVWYNCEVNFEVKLY